MNTRAKRILVVDDEASMRSVISAMLVEHGYEVSTAASGKDGLRMAVEESFDLILTDNSMPPGITGGEMIRAFREYYPESPPIIMVSGDEMEATPGLNGFLKKPFKFESLIVMVERLTVPYLH